MNLDDSAPKNGLSIDYDANNADALIIGVDGFEDSVEDNKGNETELISDSEVDHPTNKIINTGEVAAQDLTSEQLTDLAQQNPNLLALIDTMDTLLGKDGCPWDKEQTHRTLAKYLLEETYEALEAIETDDGSERATGDMVEELGDVLFQIVFHARLGQTEGRFNLDDVARAANEKMRGRHPHVFGAKHAETAEDVTAIWASAKAREKSDRQSVLDGIPQQLPALDLADKVLGRAGQIGLVDTSQAAGFNFESEEDLGRALLAVVVSGKAHGLDAERALRTTLRELQDEVRAFEQQSPGQRPAEQPAE